MSSSGNLHGVEWKFRADVSGQPSLKSQKRADLIGFHCSSKVLFEICFVPVYVRRHASINAFRSSVGSDSNSCPIFDQISVKIVQH